MAIIDIKVPTIAESVTEVTLSQWLKPNGSVVKIDEPICEFESDKATLELPAEAAGTLIHVAAEGTDLKIGDLIARIDTSASASATPAPAKKEETTATPAPAPAKKEETTATPAPAPAKKEETTATPAPAPAKKEETTATPAPAKKEETTATPEPAPAKKEETTATPAPVTANYATGTPSPAAEKYLAESGLKPEDVEGTGKDARITKNDALKAIENKAAVAAEPKTETPKTEPAKTETLKTEAAKTETPEAATPVKVAKPQVAFSRNESRVKMSRMRQTIAKRLVSAKNTTAMLTTFNEVDMSAIIALREKYQDKFVKKFGVKLGFMSIFAKACSKVLLEMPDVNASIDGTDIIYHEYTDISFAISTPSGLVVPPIRNCESLSFADIEKQLKVLADKARNGKLTIEEMQGGTFTITNGGVFGSLMSTPIINEPQSAILGMHATKDRPVVMNGQIVIRPMMYLAMSYDHRIIDGSTSVTFLVKVKELLEDPTSLFLDV